MRPSEFLTELWGANPAGRIQLWRLSDRKAFYPISAAAADYYIGAPDMFTCVALTFPKRAATAAGRPRAEHGVALAGMWLDIDQPPLEAHAIANAVMKPTLTVNSGNGVHAWWLLDKPWLFRTKEDQADAQTLAWQWQQHHRNVTGVQLDATHDLARLMRLPGTINAKEGARAPVDATSWGGTRWSLDDIRAVAAAAGPASNTMSVLPPGMGSGSGEVNVSVPGRLPPGTLDVLLEDPDFAAAWTHRRTLGDGSPSAYDMSIASQLHHAGNWTDQQIAEVIAAHRLHHNPADTKHKRIKYLEKTIARARAGHDTEAPRDLLRALRTDAREAA